MYFIIILIIIINNTSCFFSVSLPPPLRTSDTLTCHFVARLIPPRPVSWQKNEILRSWTSNGRRAAVSPRMPKKNTRLLFRFTPPTLAHLWHPHLPFCCTFGEFFIILMIDLATYLVSIRIRPNSYFNTPGISILLHLWAYLTEGKPPKKSWVAPPPRKYLVWKRT